MEERDVGIQRENKVLSFVFLRQIQKLQSSDTDITKARINPNLFFMVVM